MEFPTTSADDNVLFAVWAFIGHVSGPCASRQFALPEFVSGLYIGGANRGIQRSAHKGKPDGRHDWAAQRDGTAVRRRFRKVADGHRPFLLPSAYVDSQ